MTALRSIPLHTTRSLAILCICYFPIETVRMAPRSPSTVPTDDDGPASRLSDGVRTVISLVLFVHLFALGLLFLSNFEGGDWDSVLLRRMKIVLRPYLYPLWLDRPYHYHLTYAEPLDFDHYIEVALTEKDSPEETIVRLPAEDLGIGQRRQRYLQLAWHFARRAELPTADELLPLTIGAGLIRQHDATRAQVRCFRKRPLFFDEVVAGTNTEVPDERIYAADVFFLPGNQQPQLNKIGEARDVAPVTRPSDSGSQGTPQRPSERDSSSGAGDRAAPLRNPLLPRVDPTRPARIPPASPSGKK